MKYIHDLSGGIPLFAEVARNAIADESGNKISETYVSKEDFYETITAISSDKLDTSAFSTVSGNFITASYPFTANLGGASKITVSGQSNLEVNQLSNVIFANRTNFSAITDKLLQGTENSCSEVSFVQGQYNTGAYCSMAQGLNNNAGNQSQAFGIGNVITNTGMAIGTYNKTSSDASFVIGNGTNSDNRSDLFIIKHNGTVSSTGDFIVDGKSLSNVHNTVSTNSGEWLKASDLNNYVTTSDLETTSGKLLTTAQYATDSAAFALKEEIPSTVTQLTDSGNYYQKTDTSSKDEISNALTGKQNILTAGTNLVINNGVIGVITDNCSVNSTEYAFVEGVSNTAQGPGSHAEGTGTSANGMYSHVEGVSTTTNAYASHAEGWSTKANGYASHTEGKNTIANNQASHAEGYGTSANGMYSHSEGYSTLATGNYSHAEGRDTIASGDYSHSEGESTSAIGDNSHAEGKGTSAKGMYSHAEGTETSANGKSSHAEGYRTLANGDYSHAEGIRTIAGSSYMLAVGKYNYTTANATFVIGNGTSTAARSDILYVTDSDVVFVTGGNSFSLTKICSALSSQYTITV